ncbi:MarR family winged helix-turn-helix transcriptional regulator [Leifsonia poae]|uniref:MarR family winged helix-turn-helix transcriptional regulator n=1 Tax=Leifsonia poae TaxID=110933 RepID=UPI001CBC425D|nr:MarR family transcriptional regulator [Leifsonia poae]
MVNTASDTPTPKRDAMIDALVQTSYRTMAALTRVGAEFDLSLTQLRLLGILQDRRLRMTELADYLGLDKSTMTGLVTRAEKRGLLVRFPHPTDGRAVAIGMTPEGLRLGEKVYSRLAEALSPSVDALTRADRRRLQTLLERMLGQP